MNVNAASATRPCPFTPQANTTTMTIQTVNVSTLKRVKNNVIGNPSAKLSLAQDELFVATSVACLSPSRFPSKPPLPASSNASTLQNNSRRLRDRRMMSVSRLPTSSPRYLTVRRHYYGTYPTHSLRSSSPSPIPGSPEALRSILHANAHRAFLFAMSRFGPSEPTATKAAFARALRAIAAACAELVGPSQWGLKDDSSPVREEAKLALEYFFQVITSHHLPYHETLTASA
jgi:armadillo repeat-containing protein 8